MKQKEKNIENPLIGIIGGKGRMGNLFKNFFESCGLKVLISDVNTEIKNEDLAKKADIVIIAVPISKTIRVIKEIRSFVKKDALLCDITSLKAEPIKAMKLAKSGVLGMHPLFGPSIPYVERQQIAFCRVKDNEWVDFLKRIFIEKELKIIEITAKEHDYQMAVIQALISFSNISLARTLQLQKMKLKGSFLTPIFKLQSLVIGRILAQNPEMYADIEIKNPFFLKVLNDFEKEFLGLAKDVKNEDAAGFIKKFKETSSFLSGFRKIAQIKSLEVLRVIDEQPIKEEIVGVKKILGKKGLKVGFLGPKGTFSHQAAHKLFKNAELIPAESIKKIFQQVNEQKVSFGIVPIENATGGIVPATINSLIDYPVKVSGSFSLPIHQCLLGRADSLAEIKVVKSHHQALSQCAGWLDANLPKAKLETSESTTSPIEQFKGVEVGFVASEIAARFYGLKLLAKNIEDNKNNTTKFYLISRKVEKKMQKYLQTKKTVMLFSAYDRVGILRDILDVFANNKINLSCLHSIPSHSKPWDYFFFVEADAPYKVLLNKNIIKSLGDYCPLIRIVGIC